MAQDREKTAYLTLLSVISSFAVVILHANGCFWHFSTERYWVTANVIESVFYFAVPIFFMISGATLLDYRDRYDTREFVRKRVKKTLIPFLFWSLFGLLFALLVTNSVSFRDLGVSGVINSILNAKHVEIYWFFLTLFALYAAIPLISLVPREKKETVFGWAFFVLFCTSSLIPFLLNVFRTNVHWPLDPGSPTSYLLYLFLGYVLSRKELTRPQRLVFYGSALLGLLAHCLGTYALSVKAGWIVNDFKGYLNLPCVLYAAGIFVFFKEHGNRLMQGPLGKATRAVAPYTFTVYLLHWFMLRLIQKLFSHFGVIVDYSIWYRLGAVAVIVPLCMLVGFVFRKIPLLKHTLPS